MTRLLTMLVSGFLCVACVSVVTWSPCNSGSFDRVTYTSNFIDGIAYIRATYTEYSFFPPNMADFRQDCLQIALKTAQDISQSHNNALTLTNQAKIMTEVSRDEIYGNNICAINFPMTVKSLSNDISSANFGVKTRCVPGKEDEDAEMVRT